MDSQWVIRQIRIAELLRAIYGAGWIQRYHEGIGR
jgi:hypothetical protein